MLCLSLKLIQNYPPFNSNYNSQNEHYVVFSKTHNYFILLNINSAEKSLLWSWIKRGGRSFSHKLTNKMKSDCMDLSEQDYAE